MTDIEYGLYESLITESLADRLSAPPAKGKTKIQPLRNAEASDRLALHLSRCVVRVVESLPEKDRAVQGARLARELIALLQYDANKAVTEGDMPLVEPQVLRAIQRELPDGSLADISEPLTPLLDTTLLTNAPGEPRVGQEIATEIVSADRIDVVMAFVRYSGIRPFISAIRQHTEAGRSFRLLTTTYTGSTEARALVELAQAGVDVRVSYDVGSTRLHAKAWLFHRHSGHSTAYVGSSNLTHMAQVDGLEWNVRLSEARNVSVIDKVRAVFDVYWHDGDFEPFDADIFADRTASTHTESTLYLPPTALHAMPFQARLLEQIAIARRRGRHRNLLVAATGTGKTVMAALDYASLIQDKHRPPLLFVAQRKEILMQALGTFRHALGDAAFGELWVGGDKPVQFKHVFASIQTFSTETLSRIDSNHFDVVIVDEFHHAAAASYQRLLAHVSPRELLGLTATPERADGLSVLDQFDGRIAAELRLWDAIDQHRLVPFAYFGVADSTDLTRVKWRRGHGYDVDGLTKVLTADDAIAKLVLRRLIEHVPNVQQTSALGFCVSVAHARFMARVFCESGVESRAVWGDTPATERALALAQLRDGTVRVLFSVDLFNEGVDVPNVDTLLMLRPTQSGTLFLQQLGRGLRRNHGKRVCTVLDFVGQHRKEFRYDRRLRALLGGTRGAIEKQVKQGFPFLPAGCHLEMDAVAQARVLASLRDALPSNLNQRAAELRDTGDSATTLTRFLEDSGLDLEDVYAGQYCWSALREKAGFPIATAGPFENIIRKAIGRLLHVDDAQRLQAWKAFLQAGDTLDIDSLELQGQRLLGMLVQGLISTVKPRPASLRDAWHLLTEHPQVMSELLELFVVLEDRPRHDHRAMSDFSDFPLQVHARYTRLEILAACGEADGQSGVPVWREGVKFAKGVKADLLAFTLDKTEGGFSPTTRYRDYAISRDLIHWESQNATSESSPTGQRYRQHVVRGSSIFLFARECSAERAFTFLGSADYVSHEGERPMAITWKLRQSLPGDLYARYSAAVA